MKRITYILALGALLLMEACVIITETRPKDHGIKYRQITDPLEEITYEKNSFDYVPINSKTIAWYKKCRMALVREFDSNNPESGLTDNAKVDSLFRVIQDYYKLDNDEYLSCYLGIPKQRKKKCIILFHITEKTLALIHRDSSFINEQKAWERMQMALEEYYLTAEEILYTGGSGSDVLCLMAMNDIYRNRDNDLQRMLKNNCVDANNIQVARGKFIHSVDSIEKYIKEEFTKEEWKTWRDIPQLIDKMHNARKPLIRALDDWISERKRYDGCANAIIDLNHTISDVR